MKCPIRSRWFEEGPRMISNVIGIPSDKVVCDMPVQVVYEDINDAATLPKFMPARS